MKCFRSAAVWTGIPSMALAVTASSVHAEEQQSFKNVGSFSEDPKNPVLSKIIGEILTENQILWFYVGCKNSYQVVVLSKDEIRARKLLAELVRDENLKIRLFMTTDNPPGSKEVTPDEVLAPEA